MTADMNDVEMPLYGYIYAVLLLRCMQQPIGWADELVDSPAIERSSACRARASQASVSEAAKFDDATQHSHTHSSQLSVGDPMGPRPDHPIRSCTQLLLDSTILVMMGIVAIMLEYSS